MRFIVRLKRVYIQVQVIFNAKQSELACEVVEAEALEPSVFLVRKKLKSQHVGVLVSLAPAFVPCRVSQYLSTQVPFDTFKIQPAIISVFQKYETLKKGEAADDQFFTYGKEYELPVMKIYSSAGTDSHVTHLPLIWHPILQFKYADRLDVTLMAVGSLFAIFTGTCLPIISFFFGGMTNIFIRQSLYVSLENLVGHDRNGYRLIELRSETVKSYTFRDQYRILLSIIP